MSCYWNNFSWDLLGTMPIHLNIFGRPKGVYIIWYYDFWGNPVTVRVGRGDIKGRLTVHRLDSEIRRYAVFRTLYVSWTPILVMYQQKGVERYLGDTLDPLVGEDFPRVLPIAVNLPWD